MSSLLDDPTVQAGLGLLGIPPLPDLGALDEHIAAVDDATEYHRQLASHGAGASLLAVENQGPAADAVRADLTGSGGLLAQAGETADGFAAQGHLLRTTRAVIEWAAAILATLAIAAVTAFAFFPELLPRLIAMAKRVGEMIREAMARLGEIFRTLVDRRYAKEVEGVAIRLHDVWREPRLLGDGTYEPKFKPTTDKKWIKRHGTDQVDIANNHYLHLPVDRQKEVKASARVAVRQIRQAKRNGVDLESQEFMESASSKIHDAWLKRNLKSAESDQKLPYPELTELEKQKDRDVLIEALKFYGIVVTTATVVRLLNSDPPDAPEVPEPPPSRRDGHLDRPQHE